MKIMNLEPHQIITLNDYPLLNEQILKLYFKMFQKVGNRIVPPCPVIHKNLVVDTFESKLKLIF